MPGPGEANVCEMPMAGREIKLVDVIDILPDRAFVRIDDQAGWLPVGSSLGDLIANPAPNP